MAKVAAVQINASDNVDDNLHQIEQIVASLSEQEVQLILLPECAALMPKTPRCLLAHAEVYGEGKIQRAIATLAKRHRCWIVLGSLPIVSDQPDKVFNTLLVYNDAGRCLCRYDKLHLFDVSLSASESYNESSYTVAGDSVRILDSPIGKIGLSICYDLRFAELYGLLAEQGAEVLLVPAAFAYSTGQHHWLALLKARAIENSCYVVAAAQTGLHANGRETWGHSVIINPWGEVERQLATDCGAITTEIDLQTLYDQRRKLPSLTHKRKDIFR